MVLTTIVAMQQLEITTNELVNSKGEELEENTRSNEKTRCQQQQQENAQQEHAQQEHAQHQQPQQQQHAQEEEEQQEQIHQQQEQEKQQEQIQQLQQQQQQQQQQQHVESSSHYDVPRLHSSTQELSYAQEYQQLPLIPVDSSSSENNSSRSSRSSSTLFKGPQWEDWSSNIFFLLGSILYVWLAIWDIMDDMEDEEDDEDNNDNDDDDEYDNDNSFLSTLTSKYVILSLFAASCYLMDATFQIIKLVRQCDREYSDPSYYNATPLHEHDDNDNDNDDNNNNDDDVPIEHEEQEEEEEDGEVPVIVVVVVDGGGTLVVDLDEHPHHHYRSFGHGQPAVTITTTTTTTTPSSNERNHSCFGGNGGGWRRKKTYLSASVGLTFGGAAVFDLIGAIWTDRDDIISEKYAIAAVDVYLVNALLLTSPILLSTISFFCQYCCKRWSSRNVCQNQEFDLGYFGDLLFLIGSIIDVMVSYWEYESDSILYVDFGFLLSALLWLLDALLYIAADWIGFQEVCRLETENNNNNTISFVGGDRNLLENDHGPSGETSGIS